MTYHRSPPRTRCLSRASGCCNGPDGRPDPSGTLRLVPAGNTCSTAWTGRLTFLHPVQYFGPAARKCVSSSLLRAGAALSEAESVMRFAAASKPAEAAIPTADLAAVKSSKCVFVDLRAPLAQASTGARLCRPAWSLVSQLLTSAGAGDLKTPTWLCWHRALCSF